MSHSIVYRHLLLKVSMARALTAMQELTSMSVTDFDRFITYGEQAFGVLLFAEAGSNNMIDILTNEPSRAWGMPFLGGAGEYIEAMIDQSKYVERDTLRTREIRQATPEKFIAFHRKLLAAGLPMEAAPHGGELGGSPVIHFRVKLDPERFSVEERGLQQRISEHPFTEWVRNCGALQQVGDADRFGPTDFTWRLSLDLSDPTRREAILGWMVACAGHASSEGFVQLDYPDRGALTPWLERIWRETAAARLPRRRA